MFHGLSCIQPLTFGVDVLCACCKETMRKNLFTVMTQSLLQHLLLMRAQLGFTSSTLTRRELATPSIVLSFQPLRRHFVAGHQFKLVVACARLLMLKPWPMRESHEL
jgi:hypothetical protein